MASNRIRLTFFWADQAAAVQDFRAKHTQKMVDWANDFFMRYDFELDVAPALGGDIAEAYKHCLVKSGGYEPDFSSALDTYSRQENEKLPANAARSRLFNTRTELRDQEAAKRDAVDAAKAARDAVPATDPARPQLQATLDALTAELVQLGRDLAATEPELKKLEKEIDDIEKKYLVEKEERDFQTVPRLQLGQKIIESFPVSAVTRIKSPNENEYIFSGRRLKVILARFRQSPRVMQMRLGKQPLGVTIPPINFNWFNGKYVFDGVYITIDLLKFEQITLAHEIVHAAGRGHRRPKILYTHIPTWITKIRMDPAGKLIVPSIYEYEPDVGYADGPKNDIINYNSKGKDADKVILQPSDKDNLLDSFFVKPPDAMPRPFVMPPLR